ncbi:MAG: AraC family transcriptional regulator [Opitutaceae bacterium]|jgi:AraC-like DNA-binding protein
MFLTKTPNGKTRGFAALAASTRRLPSPDSPLHGKRRPAPPLPENIICFQRRSGAELNRPHTGRAMHHRHVLIVPLRGKGVVCADDRELPLAPGKGLVILPYQYHHYAHADKGLHWLFITFEYAQGVTMEPLRNVIFPVGAELAGQLDTLLRAQRNLADEGLPELRLALLLAQLTPPPGLTAPAASRTGATLELQVNHSAQKLRPAAPTIRELAAELGMSPSNLRTRFRASCGVSLGKHMRELRLERACGLLRMTSARISEIAEQCGFNSLFSFSRAFRVRHGLSPKAYRESVPAE